VVWSLPDDPSVGDFVKASWGQDVHDCLDHLFDGTKINAGLVAETSLGASAVARTKLKTTAEAYGANSTTGTVITFSSIGEYGFFPNGKSVTGGGGNVEMTAAAYHSTTDTSYVTKLYLTRISITGGSPTTNWSIRYVQASPPHQFGGMLMADGYPWLVLLRNASRGIERSWSAGDPWYWLRHHNQYPKGHPASMLARPHPFVDDVPEIPAGWSIELIDLRCEMEEVDHHPIADQLAKLESEREQHIARGIDAAEADRWIVEAQTKKDAEAASQAKARTLAEEIPLEAEWRKQDILRAKKLDPMAKQARCAEIDHAVSDALDSIRMQTGRIPRAVLLREQQETKGQSLLQLVHEGKWQAVENATRCLSDDEKHPDRKHLPQIPGLFIPAQDGTPPIVRVMTQA
jgi:hypothetical protein